MGCGLDSSRREESAVLHVRIASQASAVSDRHLPSQADKTTFLLFRCITPPGAVSNPLCRFQPALRGP
eukprot:41334-Pleurochrysis_carterae.AAC.1